MRWWLLFIMVLWTGWVSAAPFEDLVLEYGYITEDFLQRTNGYAHSACSVAQNDHIAAIQSTFDSDMEHLRVLYYENNNERDAVVFLLERILGACHIFGLTRYGFIPFPQQPEYTATTEQQYACMRHALSAIRDYYKNWQPELPLHKRIQELVLYNFFSTHVVPHCVYGVGWLVTGWYALAGMRIWLAYLKSKAEQYEKMDAVRQQFASRVTNYQRYSDHPDWPKNAAGDPLFDDRANLLEYANGSRALSMNGFVRSGMTGVLRIGKLCMPVVAGSYARDWMREFQDPRYKERLMHDAQARERAAAQKIMVAKSATYEEHISFASVKGLDGLIDTDLRVLVDYLKHPFKYQHAAPGTYTVLFYGPPGTGKTLASRAIAYESGAPFVEMNAEDLLHADAKQKIVQIVEMTHTIAAQRPEKSVILYLDEIDCLVDHRASGGGDALKSKALAQMLALLDGVKKHNRYLHVLIIITTNHLHHLDEALVRPGRINRKLFVGLPDADGRRALLVSVGGFDQETGLLDRLVEATHGMSGAQLVDMVRTVKMQMAYRGGMSVSMEAACWAYLKASNDA